MVWQEIKHAEDQLMYIQKQLNIAFESQTANAIQLWLNNMNSNSFKIHQDLLTDCEQTIKLDQ